MTENKKTKGSVIVADGVRKDEEFSGTRPVEERHRIDEIAGEKQRRSLVVETALREFIVREEKKRPKVVETDEAVVHGRPGAPGRPAARPAAPVAAAA